MIQNPVLLNMLSLLRAALNGAAYSLPDPALWPEIKKELEAQTVLPLVSDCLSGSNISEKEKLEVTKSVAVSVRAFHRLMSAQAELLSLLNANSISAAIMKGAAAAQYYPEPALRQFGDIDILVLPEDYQKTFQLLLDSGYHNLQEYDSFCDRHIGFTCPSGVKVELHRYFSTSTDQIQNRVLDDCLFNAMKMAHSVHVGGYAVSVFPPLENGLILLGHINQHLSSGLGLRQITDWMMYVQAELSDTFWLEQFQPKADAVGMTQLAKAVTRMCQIYLGLSSEITWCSDVDDQLAEELMLYILNKGNFGQKISRDSRKTITVLHAFSNPRQAFHYLTKAGMLHMAEDGVKLSKAFAWLYQIRHLIREHNKRQDKKEIEQDLRCSVAESALLKKLKITRM